MTFVKPTDIKEIYKGQIPFVHSGTIFATIHGSHAYGLATKNHGIWKYEDLIAWAEKEEKEIAEIAKSSLLPKEPNMIKLNSLCQETIELFHQI